MRRPPLLLLALLLALLLPTAAASAQGWVVPRPCPRCGPIATPARVVRTASDVRAELADGVLRFEVTETFVNRGSGLGEADYLFPLPAGAALQDLRLSIDGKLVAGETLGAEEARTAYEEIVRSQRDPALVEWMGRGLLRARIFPLPSGEARRVVVRFQQVAVREGDALRVDYFRGAAPGGAAGSPSGPVPRIEPARDEEQERDRDGFVLTYPAGATYGEPYSPTHEVRVRRDGDVRRATVRGAAGEVTLLVPVRRGDAASITVLPHATGDDARFALVTVSLPERSTRRTPRDVTLVLDVSGSMSGRKIEQARDAGKQLLRTLRRDDRFRIVDFSSDVRSFPERDGDGPEFADVGDAAVRAAERYLDALEATGGTNIEGALREAMRPRAAAGRLPLVLFVTDGEPTVGERRPDALADSARAWRATRRLFTFGLGADVNSALVEQLALEGRGTAQFVRPAESVERAVSVVASRLADPVATDVRVRVEGSGVRLTNALPNGPVDVFAGQDLVLLARYDGSGPARVRVEGRTPTGAGSWSADARFPDRERGNAFVPRLWATQRVGWLSAELRRNGGSPELETEIRTLGERYGIPTPYTSYLVREPAMLANMRGVAGGMVRAQASGAGAPPPMAAPAPAAEQLRADRFEAARKASEQRAARSLAAVDAAADRSSVATRRVGTRSFALVDGVWTDVRLTSTTPPARVVRVRGFSDAYFALLRALPELRDALALGDRVRVAGREVAIEVGAQGVETLPAGELAALVRSW